MLRHPAGSHRSLQRQIGKENRILLRSFVHRGLLFKGWFIALVFLPVASFAQQPAERITAEIDDNERATIAGSHSPLARPENEAGRMAASIKLEGLSLVFSRTSEQETELQVLIAAQQDPTSPSYHQWLSPEEFGARFGVTDGDIAKVQFWLEKRGFTMDGVSRSKNGITFSGTVEQVEASFGTEMHYYKLEGETHFSASLDIGVPAALSSLVLTVTNLSDFHPKPHLRLHPNFTSSQSGNHFLTPKDVATIYDITPAYNAGFNGAGESIAVVGQSDIVMTDVENFQAAAGFTPVKDPIRVLASTTNPGPKSGDESESDLDVEYTSTIANGATIYFVFSSQGAFDALSYAVQNKTAPIISVSYGVCEIALGLAGYSSVNAILAQAASQGQSVIAASGDAGSTDCSGTMGLTTAKQQAIAVDFPSSSQYATGMGGTEFPTADVSGAGAGSYWLAANGSDVITSAIKYIPEQVWNDDVAEGTLASGGGGTSTFTSRPTWQTGVPGIPSGTMRLVPDISLSSSNFNAPYLLCSSDTSTKVTGSCAHGFRDTNNTNLTTAGGTSFAAPIFAGMVAIINQKLGKSQGLLNPALYTLAANASTYGSAFHDITSSGNQCLVSSATICTGAAVSDYAATVGYDEASGLGSIDFFNLLSAWPGSSTSLAASKTTLVAATTTPVPGTSDVVTIAVAPASASSTATPTGTLTVVVDGAAQTLSLALANGSATYTFSSAAAGSHTITATYSGDATYAASTGSITITVTAVQSNTTLSAATTTPGAAANDVITIMVTSGAASSTATPTGTATVTVDGAAQTATLMLANGAATYTFSSTTTGSHTISATYSGDSTYAGSTNSLTLTVVAKSFMLAVTSATVSAGSSGTSTVTVTPQSGYTGTIAWTVSSSPALANGCFSLPNTTVSGTSTITATLTVFTMASSCPAAAIASATARQSIVGVGPHFGDRRHGFPTLQAIQLSLAITGLLGFWLASRRWRGFAVIGAASVLVLMSISMSGCGGGGGSSSSSPTPVNTPAAAKGTYTVTIKGTDTVTSSITQTATMTLTVD